MVEDWWNINITPVKPNKTLVKRLKYRLIVTLAPRWWKPGTNHGQTLVFSKGKYHSNWPLFSSFHIIPFTLLFYSSKITVAKDFFSFLFFFFFINKLNLIRYYFDLILFMYWILFNHNFYCLNLKNLGFLYSDFATASRTSIYVCRHVAFHKLHWQYNWFTLQRNIIFSKLCKNTNCNKIAEDSIKTPGLHPWASVVLEPCY